MSVSYPSNYERGALNPWAGFVGDTTLGAANTGNSQSYLATPFLLGVVLYAWREEVEPDTYSESDPLNIRELKQETVFVKVRIPEIHRLPIPRSLPSNNNQNDQGADWDAINRYPSFQASDATIIQMAIPQPGEIVMVDFRDRVGKIGPIYLGPMKESVRPAPTPFSPSSASQAFAKPTGNNSTINKFKPKDAKSKHPNFAELYIPETQGTPMPPGIQIPLIKPGLEFSVTRANLRKIGDRTPSMPSGGKYPTGLRHPATNIVIHEPGAHIYYGQKRLHRVLSAQGLGLHYSLAGVNGKGYADKCDPGIKEIYQHMDPVTHFKSHASPFNQVSVGIELLRPTYQDKEPDGRSYFKLPRWWGGGRSPNKSIYLPAWNDFEPLFKLVNYLINHPGLYVPLQFPGVRIPGVNMNEKDHTNAVPMSSYSQAFFQWGSPWCAGRSIPKAKRIPVSPDGHRRQAPDNIVARGEPMYPQPGNKGHGYHISSHPVRYSRGIMAHARWHHSDALCAEYYCLMRFMGYGADEAYALTKSATRNLSDDTNITRLPPIKPRLPE